MRSTSYRALPIQPKSGCIRPVWPCAVAGGSQEDTSRILRITFLNSGRFKDQNDI